MITRVLLGTKNEGKIRELKAHLSDLKGIKWLTAHDRPFASVAETGTTFQENALLKARQISRETGLPVLAEDSGLEVESLHGAPGVLSARFAGEGASDRENVEKLLQLLEATAQRRARFVCVAVLCTPEGEECVAEGELRGRIAPELRGDHGFGYDPVFVPQGYQQTLAQLGPDIKNNISHRQRALQELKEALKGGCRASPT